MTVEADIHQMKLRQRGRAGHSSERDAPPPDTPANRLRFLRTVSMTGLALAVLGPAALAHTQFRPGVATFKRWAARWAGATMWAGGLRVEWEQHGSIDPAQPYVFVSNHQSALDVLVLAKAIPHAFGFLAKKELERMPLLGFVMKGTACLFIDRSSPKASLRSLREAGARIRSGNSVLVFPEGSRSRSKELLPFKRGAFVLAINAGVPMVPIVIHDSYRYLNEPARALVPGTIHMTVGEPVDISRFTQNDSAELTAFICDRMQAMLRAGYGGV